ncbi:MAG: tyrosine-type recombinase/integrase [Thermoleophilaceae bacterium]|nr:tyrosine-type recombinase/integrase [Thermoleophilaceae bacterium]
MPPLPRTRPHTLRRTYITLALEAGLPVPFVMAQVGHCDARTTLQIYAKVLARRDRSDHGRTFDELVGGPVPRTPGRQHPAS